MSIGLNAALYMGAAGLDAAQTQLDITGRNLTDASNPNSSREVLAVNSGSDVTVDGVTIGSGVQVVGVVSTRSSYLDEGVQNENSNLGYAQNLSTFMSQLQNSLSETVNTNQADASDVQSQTGLEAATANFYNAWSSLSASPDSSTARDAVSSAAVNFVTTAKSIYNQMLSVKSGGFTEANSETTEINNLATQIASLNQQIGQASEGVTTSNGVSVNQPIDLIDNRQALIEQLSSLVNVTVTPNATNANMVNISLADQAPAAADQTTTIPASPANNSTATTVYLVQGINGGGAGTTSALSVNGADPATGDSGYAAGNNLSIVATDGSSNKLQVIPSGGSLGGLVNFDNNVIGAQNTTVGTFTAGSTAIDKFNTYINNVVTSVNSALSSGYNESGSNPTGAQAFFYTGSAASTGAFDLAVNNLYNLDSSSYNSSDIAASGSGGVLDGSTASAISASQNNASIEPFYQSFVSSVGSQTQSASTNLTNQTLLSSQTTTLRAAASGISTDEETTNLITFQRAYQASAQFISAISNMYDTLVSMVTS